MKKLKYCLNNENYSKIENENDIFEYNNYGLDRIKNLLDNNYD